jgi:wyosine [tRNA(Phe)-imidazoG37] synthetase (radical SAM superfamily)
VKSWNVDEIADYAKLVGIGKPDFIEVKVSAQLDIILTHSYSDIKNCGL